MWHKINSRLLRFAANVPRCAGAVHRTVKFFNQRLNVGSIFTGVRDLIIKYSFALNCLSSNKYFLVGQSITLDYRLCCINRWWYFTHLNESYYRIARILPIYRWTAQNLIYSSLSSANIIVSPDVIYRVISSKLLMFSDPS